MSLLEFARGPAIEMGLAVFAFGVAWRLLSILLYPRSQDRSVPRKDTPPALWTAIKEFKRRSWPPAPFGKSLLFQTVNSYVFHIGLAIIVFGLAQHILFFRNLLGPSWPSLPSNFINLVGVVTAGSLLIALGHRFTSPVLRLISTFNDYFTWLVTFLPVVTGLLAVSHWGARYETLLAVHILSVALLLVYFPFGKLMHAFLVFVTRGQTGIFYARRGAQL